MDAKTKSLAARYPPAECYLQRAISFSPKDAVPHLLFGIYLHKMGQDEAALKEYLAGQELSPNDLQIQYNIGLLYVDTGEYEKAVEYAKRVYSGGFPLAGLKNKLKEAGHWED